MTSIYIKTFGCAVNRSDSEVMAGLLSKAEFELAKSIDDAEVVIVNTCVVKGRTESKVMTYIKHAAELGKKVIVAGCITKTSPKLLMKHSMISPKQINYITDIVEETLGGNIVHLIADQSNERLNLPKIRKNKIIEIIPICAGCLGMCAYCIVKKARGHLVSYDPNAIKQQAKGAIKEGAKEIWLTAQDTGAYGQDIDLSLPKLLKELVCLPGDFKIRLGMINPNHVLKFLDELVEIYKHEKMFKFLHTPVQSGSNEILKLMNRKYTAEQFKNAVERFRKEIPDITIATDIICGFPSETEEQFNDTVALVKWLNPDLLHVSKFWQRPGTKAARMKNKVSWEDIKKRSKYIHELFKNIAFMVNERWYDWAGEVLIDEVGKDDSFVGRNFAYKPIILKGNFQLGEKVRARVYKVSSWDLRGEVIRQIRINE